MRKTMKAKDARRVQIDRADSAIDALYDAGRDIRQFSETVNSMLADLWLLGPAERVVLQDVLADLDIARCTARKLADDLQDALDDAEGC